MVLQRNIFDRLPWLAPIIVSRRSVVPQINRLVPGRVSISVDAIDIPLNTNHSTLDAESLPNLQVSILDLDIIDHQSSLVRDPTSHHDL